MNNLAKSKRVNDIFFGPLERPALKWLAERMPAWVTPDTLTLIGLFGTILIFTSYALTTLNKNFLWLASLGFVINWFGDSLDGTLARFRKVERPRYGFMVDHVVDCFGSVLMVLGMGISPFVNFTIASLTLIAYLMVSILTYVLTISNGVFRISSGKIGPTELRVFLIVANTGAFFYSKPLFNTAVGSFTIFDVVVALMGLILLVIYVVNAITESSKLAALEPATAVIRQQKFEAWQARKAAAAHRRARKQTARRSHGSQNQT
jgi:phosphatidylglycerophosphate synthase